MVDNQPLQKLKSIKERLIDFEKLKFELKDSMRYDDVGDYFDNTIISYNMKDDVINSAILLHEFIEYTLIKSAGIPSEMIDKFDTDWDYVDQFPEEYKLYRKFHRMASRVEKQFIENLGMDWGTHEKIVNTVKVQVAVQKATDELHKQYPSIQQLEKSKEIVQKELE